jgi:hypothetical protein
LEDLSTEGDNIKMYVHEKRQGPAAHIKGRDHLEDVSVEGNNIKIYVC